ncbi:MAG: tetratricopeptide repeat protein [Deltaproteobacteria bacterium]|nr:MAG: tetratricopeptide repeat protein [Deltaproteobacteria bacterium]
MNFRKILLLTVFCLVGLWPAFSSGGSGEEEYLRGRDYFSRGDYGKAREHFQKAVEEDPTHLLARYYLGLIEMENVKSLGRAESLLLELRKECRRGGALPREDFPFLVDLALGRVYIKEGHFGEAIRTIREAIAGAQGPVPLDEAHNLLGIALYRQRRYREALVEFRRALKENPEHGMARFNLKSLRVRLSHFQAGKAYSRMGASDEAVREFREAISLDPRFVEARVRLGMELVRMGKPEAALEELMRAEKMATTEELVREARFLKGRALEAMGRMDEALELFVKLVGNHPKYDPAYNEIGEILLSKGENEAARQFFIKAIQINPLTDYVRNLQKTFIRKEAR